jgi:fluoride exporter
MFKFVISVLVGGAVVSVLREYLMLIVPSPTDQFPLDILAANLVAALLLGLVTGLYRRHAVSEDVNLLVGTGIMGGYQPFRASPMAPWC